MGVLESDPAVVPERLRETDQWVAWREQDRDDKLTKVPVNVETGLFASVNDPDSWATFEAVREYAERGSASGIGFVFTDEDPFVGVDLDDCRDPQTDTTDDWATDVIEQLDSYTERSPSGTGYHVLCRGQLPGDTRRKGDLEIYEDARFFTVTGFHVATSPSAVRERGDALAAVHAEYLQDDVATSEGDADADSDGTVADSETGSMFEGGDSTEPANDLEDEQVLERARDAANGEKFDRLYRGVTSGYESHSEADFALCALLAFWTGGDHAQMDRLVRESGLYREKWDDRHYSDGATYGERTIERAVRGTDEFYSSSGASPRDEPAVAERDGTESEGADESSDSVVQEPVIDEPRGVARTVGECSAVDSDGGDEAAVSESLDAADVEAAQKRIVELERENHRLNERVRHLERAVERAEQRGRAESDAESVLGRVFGRLGL